MGIDEDGNGTGTSWSDRILWILDRYEDGSRRAMGRKLGLSGQAVSSWARAETRPSGEGLAAIIRSYPDIRARWLLTGRGQPRVAPNGEWKNGAPASGNDGANGASRPALEQAYDAGRRDAVAEMISMLGEISPVT